METKICPRCGGRVEWDDTYDYNFDTSTATEYHCGHCVKCGTDYQ